MLLVDTEQRRAVVARRHGRKPRSPSSGRGGTCRQSHRRYHRPLCEVDRCRVGPSALFEAVDKQRPPAAHSDLSRIGRREFNVLDLARRDLIDTACMVCSAVRTAALRSSHNSTEGSPSIERQSERRRVRRTTTKRSRSTATSSLPPRDCTSATATAPSKPACGQRAVRGRDPCQSAHGSNCAGRDQPAREKDRRAPARHRARRTLLRECEHTGLAVVHEIDGPHPQAHVTIKVEAGGVAVRGPAQLRAVPGALVALRRTDVVRLTKLRFAVASRRGALGCAQRGHPQRVRVVVRTVLARGLTLDSVDGLRVRAPDAAVVERALPVGGCPTPRRDR